MAALSFAAIIDITGVLAIVFIIFSFPFNMTAKTKKQTWLRRFYFASICTMLTNLFVAEYEGRPNAAAALNMAHAINMAAECAAVAVFIAYMRVCLGLKPKEWRVQTTVIYSFLTLIAVAVLFNPLHQKILSVSPATGVEERSSLAELIDLLLCIAFGECLREILQKKTAAWQCRLALSAFCVLRTAAIILQAILNDFALVNLSLILSILALHIDFSEEQKRMAVQREMELRNAQAALIFSQIQPHFLFNSMACVMDLCSTDPQEAKTALQELSDYLHYKMTAMSACCLVSFAADFDFLQNYLKLEKRRFGERLKVEYDVQCTDFKIPMLTLQPLAENAVRHGISKKPGGGTVRISSGKIAEYYTITIEDDGVGFDASKKPDDSREHIGLSNVRARLGILCGGTLSVYSTPGSGTAVEITIPNRSSSASGGTLDSKGGVSA